MVRQKARSGKLFSGRARLQPCRQGQQLRGLQPLRASAFTPAIFREYMIEIVCRLSKTKPPNGWPDRSPPKPVSRSPTRLRIYCSGWTRFRAWTLAPKTKSSATAKTAFRTRFFSSSSLTSGCPTPPRERIFGVRTWNWRFPSKIVS